MSSNLFSLTNTLFYFLVCVILYYLVKSYWKNKQFYYYASKIDGPLAFPMIGSSYVMSGGTRNLLETLLKLVEKYGSVCKLWIGNKLVVIISKPEDVRVILNKFLEKEDGYKFVIPVFGYGLITRPVKEWKGHRKTIASTFRQQILNSFVDSFNDYSKILTVKLKGQANEEYLDMFPVLTQCTLDIICSSVMGTKMNAMQEESKFILWMTRIAELSVIRMFHIYLWPDFIWRLFSISKESKDLDNKIHDYVKKVIETKRHKDYQRMEGKKIFLDCLLELTDKEGDWSDEDLIEETRSVIMAGADATAITLSYCLVMLAMHQEIQERVYEELYSLYGDSDRDVTIEDLGKLDYLERFIKETLRVFPVTSTIGRKTTSGITLGKYTLPKGTNILIAIFHIHRNPEYWPDPLKFDPDRFLPEEVAKRHPCTYLPFSYGPRNCIGFRYAYMVMKVTLANLLRHLKITKTTYKCIADLKVKCDIATKCDEGYPVKMEPRKIRSK